MKVKVKEEFRDKYTGKVCKIGDELEMTIQRINEVITAGNFIELVEQTEQEETEQEETDVQEENEDVEEPLKQTGRRKRTK